jgi:hypothetical protein
VLLTNVLFVWYSVLESGQLFRSLVPSSWIWFARTPYYSGNSIVGNRGTKTIMTNMASRGARSLRVGGGRTGLRQASNQSFVAFLCASGREFIICCMCFASGVELVILFTLLMHPSTKFAPVSQWWCILNGLHTYSCSEYI